MNTLFFLLVILLTHLAICDGVSNVGLNPLKNDEIDGMLNRVCARNIGDCAAESAAEFEMDSEVSRRLLLMERKYISYETLKRDNVPCTTPGASYYNCGTAEPNRYSRGCDVITRCARYIKD